MIRVLTYCSFANDDACLGVLILDGEHDPISAACTAHLKGLNPGGELMVVAFTADDVPASEFAAMVENMNRLIPASEARALFEAKSLREWDAEQEAAS